jgi:hypothetical protein
MKTKQHKTDDGAQKSSSDPGLREKIEIRAYEIWLADGSRNGNDNSHWLQAENEVLRERAQT